ncbi:MAG: hypothetical protein R3C61_18885 [Bacteroidia bacterium]
MGNWEDKLREKARDLRPYEPVPSWEKMEALLDQAVPPAKEKNRFRFPLFWLMAGCFVLGGVLTAVIMSSQSNHDPVATFGQQMLNPAQNQRSLFYDIDTPCKEETNSPALVVLPETKGQQLFQRPVINHISEAEATDFTLREAENKPLMTALPAISGLHITPDPIESTLRETLPAEVSLPGKQPGSEARRYASLVTHRVALALGPGEKMKWARDKWAFGIHTRLNRVPTRRVDLEYDNQTFTYYSPVLPGLLAELSYRPTARHEWGARAGFDAIWIPLGINVATPDQFTDIYGTATDLSGFYRHYFNDRQRRFRPFATATAGYFAMNMVQSRFDADYLNGWDLNSWNARKQEPASQGQPITFIEVAGKYTYLSGGAGVGVDIRLYRKLSFQYQTELYGNVPLKRAPAALQEDFSGYPYLWRNAFGLTLSI